MCFWGRTGHIEEFAPFANRAPVCVDPPRAWLAASQAVGRIGGLHRLALSAAYKLKSGSEKRKNKRKFELHTPASNPKQSRFSFTSTSPELEDPQSWNETQPDFKISAGAEPYAYAGVFTFVQSTTSRCRKPSTNTTS
ncbi:hypothetical protein EVAR_91414_1 [Eumeta japonica]|uniref:Uncharacterized protein n=1 Tax=Eumeta variegata TaxID=151549 RepID=A0A4C1X984_EUMVA|nr:hypothetical protein EVAR_91414_1 [Eumeta japonica]